VGRGEGWTISIASEEERSNSIPAEHIFGRNGNGGGCVVAVTTRARRDEPERTEGRTEGRTAAITDEGKLLSPLHFSFRRTSPLSSVDASVAHFVGLTRFPTPISSPSPASPFVTRARSKYAEYQVEVFQNRQRLFSQSNWILFQSSFQYKVCLERRASRSRSCTLSLSLWRGFPHSFLSIVFDWRPQWKTNTYRRRSGKASFVKRTLVRGVASFSSKKTPTNQPTSQPTSHSFDLHLPPFTNCSPAAAARREKDLYPLSDGGRGGEMKKSSEFQVTILIAANKIA